MEISGKTALVTGCATGIGQAGALALARKGACRVFLVDIDAAGLEGTAQKVADTGSEAIAKRVDLADPAAVMALFREVEAEGGIDILFNNAGIMSGPPAFPATPPERIPLLIAVNLTAVILCSRLAIDLFSRRGGGVIVNTSSQGALRYGRSEVAGRRELVEDAPYAASKAGVQMFTQTCAPLRESHNIRVNAVCPGVVDTPILASTGGDRPAAWLEPQLARTRKLAPEDVADAVVALIEDDSRAGEYIHVANT